MTPIGTLDADPDKAIDWEMTPTFAWRAEIGRGCLVGVFTVLVLCLFQVLDPSFEIVDDDAISSWQPIFTDFARQLRSGHMPVWSHHTQCGYPLLGWPQPTFVYPVHWLSHLICAILGWEAREIFVSTFLHFFVATVGSFVFLRRFGIVPAAAVTGSCAYALSGILLGLGTSWPIYVFTAAYWPLVLLAIEELRAGKPARFWMLLLGLLGGLGFLFLDLATMIKFALFPFLYFLLRSRRQTFWLNSKQLAIAGMLALLIGIGQWLPAAEIILGSFRMGQGGTDVFTTPPTLWFGFLFPFWMLHWEYGNLRAAGGFFVGPCALLGALFVMRNFLPRRGPQRALLILAGVYLGLSLGQHWYPSVALQTLPIFSSFRWPFRWMLEASAALALLSGFGLQLAYEELGKNRGKGTLLVFLAISSFVLLMRYDAPPGLAQLTTAMMILWAFGLIALWLTARPERRALFLGLVCVWTLIALVANIPVTQLTVVARMTQLVNDPIVINQDAQERVLFLSRHDELVKAQCEGRLALSFPHQFQTRTVFGYVYRPAGQSWMEGVEVNGLLYDDGVKPVIRHFLSPASTLLATLRVGHVVIPAQNKALLDACDAHPKLRFEQETRYHRIYRYQGFKEPAFFVRSLKIETSRDDIVELGFRVNLPEEVLLEPAYAGPRDFSGTGAVRDFHEEHGHITMNVDNQNDGFLVVTTSYFPRWRATIDGTVTPLYRANGSFLAMRVPPGRHEIELEYWPLDHLILLAISGLTLLFVAGYCVTSATTYNSAACSGKSLPSS